METSSFSIGNSKICFTFHVDEEKHLSFYNEPDVSLSKDQDWVLRHKSNPVEIQLSGEPTFEHTGDRHICTSESETLRYVSHSYNKQPYGLSLSIKQSNANISVISHYDFYKSANAIRCYNEVSVIGREEVIIEYISSFAKKDMIGYGHYESANLSVPNNAWFLEAQWDTFALSKLGIQSANSTKTFKKFSISNTGAWSTKTYLPMGILSDPITRQFFLWEIESNGSWTYELGDYLGNVSLNLSGPSLNENGCAIHLLPGESFQSVKVMISESKRFSSLLDNLTTYRRLIMAPHKEEKKLPIIFNEYMFASWNRPNEVSTRLLAPMAKKLGADIYVIDCGWHDEADEPFYYLGRWEESKKRFPHGLKTTLDMISSLGMRTGLWLEPEVVGAKGDAKTIYDDDCYFHRGGKPLIVSNRYQLNFTNPKVTGHLFNVIKGLIDQYGVSYFKLDYNIEPGIGFEMGDKSLGEALLLHNRAYHSFVGSLRKAFPDVIIESCASGGNRLDYLTLDNVDLVSSSDQTDYLIYPYIVANILSAVLPEQSGVWCYPKRDDTLPEKVDYEAINLNCLNTYVGRVHLASRMYLLDEAKQSFIATMLKEYHSFDDLRLSGLPYLPKGFSSFGDSSLAFGLKNQKRAMLLVYAMKGTAPIRIPCGSFVSIKEAFPKKELSTKYEVVGHNLVFYPERDCIARLFEISYE